MARINLIAMGIGLAAGAAAWAYVRYDPSPTAYAPAILALVALGGLVAAAATSSGFSLGLISFALVASVGLGALVFSGSRYVLYVVLSLVLALTAWALLTRPSSGTMALVGGTLAGLLFFVLLWWVAISSTAFR